MSAWNTDISAAPLFEGFVNARMVKNSETGERCALPFNDTRRVDMILASKCGKVIKTDWIPDENRFAGFQPGEEIVGWMPWPKHPYEMDRFTESSFETGSEEAENARKAAPETEDGSVNHAGAGESPATHFMLDDVGGGA